MAYYGDAHGRDIEEPLPCDTAVANSDQPISPTSPTHENPDSIKDYEDGHTSKAGFLAKSISLLHRLFTEISDFIYCTLIFILFSLLNVSLTLFSIVYILITRDTRVLKVFESSSPSSRKDENNCKKKRLISRKRWNIHRKIRGLRMTFVIRLGCLVLVWLVLNLTIPSIRNVTLFGSFLWTWSLLAALILLGFPILVLLYEILFSYIIPNSVSKRFDGSNLEYYIRGLSQSIMIIIYLASILATWFLCIDTSHPRLHRYGTLTLVSFVVGAVLHVVKSIILLMWKTRLIYKKYKRVILLAGCQLYFYITLIMDDRVPGSELLVSWWDWENYRPKPFDDSSARLPPRFATESLKHIVNIVIYLTDNYECILSEHNSVLDLTLDLQQKFSNDERLDFNILTTVRENSSMDETDSQLLLELLQTETSKESPTYEDFEKWMVDGYKLCHLVGLKLVGANERMDILDSVFTSSILFLVILVWLFITGLATTNIVVALASLFLGISFVFADACKAFFLGLIFTFVIIPYDVGDRCVINDTELLVKKINILSTIFENRHKNTVMFSNLDLSTKNIVILEKEVPLWYFKSEPSDTELEDLIELHLHSSTSMSRIRELQQHINKCLQDGIKCGWFSSSYDITVEEDAQNVKMNIHFKHNLVDEDVSMKRKQRSKLFLEIKQYMEDTTSTNQCC